MDKLLQILKGLGIPFAYDHFAEGAAPEPPFICYLVYGSNNMCADDSVFLKVERVYVELYTDKKDPVTEAALEVALAPYCWDKTETYIESERLFQITYGIEV